MATNYVSSTKAGKSLSAWVILNKGEHVATIRAHYSDNRVLVNVCNIGAAAKRSAKTEGKGEPYLYFMGASASGYGYDRVSAALAGMIVDGHTLVDHGVVSQAAGLEGLEELGYTVIQAL